MVRVKKGSDRLIPAMLDPSDAADDFGPGRNRGVTGRAHRPRAAPMAARGPKKVRQSRRQSKYEDSSLLPLSRDGSRDAYGRFDSNGRFEATEPTANDSFVLGFAGSLVFSTAVAVLLVGGLLFAGSRGSSHENETGTHRSWLGNNEQSLMHARPTWTGNADMAVLQERVNQLTDAMQLQRNEGNPTKRNMTNSDSAAAAAAAYSFSPNMIPSADAPMPMEPTPLAGGVTTQNVLQGLGPLPSNVLVVGCGLGNRLLAVTAFLDDAGNRSAGVIWTTSITMAASWSDLFKTPLPTVVPLQLSAVNYRWTTTEYNANPLAGKTLDSGKVVKSTVGHYAELAGLEDAKFVQQPATAKPNGGGWIGLAPAEAAAHAVGADVTVSVGCLARKFGRSPNNFLKTLQPVDEVQKIVMEVKDKIDQMKETGGCARMVGLHIRRGDIERKNDGRNKDVFSDEQLAATLKTWPADVCFFVATDKHRMVEVVRATVGEARTLSLAAAESSISSQLNGDLAGRTEVRGMQMAVADMFALAETSFVYAQPSSTYSVSAAWIGDVPYSEMTLDYAQQEAMCTGVPAGQWGKRGRMHYPVKCWLPLPFGETPAQAEAQAARELVAMQPAVAVSGGSATPAIVPGVLPAAVVPGVLPAAGAAPLAGVAAPLAASGLSPPGVTSPVAERDSKIEAMLCQSKNGILAMEAIDDTGICCPSMCGAYCAKVGGGCGDGSGGSSACCVGKIKKDGPLCHLTHPGNLETLGCKMQRVDTWAGR